MARLVGWFLFATIFVLAFPSPASKQATLPPAGLIGTPFERTDMHALVRNDSEFVITQKVGPAGRSSDYCELKPSPGHGAFLPFNGEAYAVLTSGGWALAIPLLSGGSGGVFDTVVFVAKDGGLRFAGLLTDHDGHTDVQVDRARGVLVYTTPKYATGDADCCPTNERIRQYLLDGLLYATSPRLPWWQLLRRTFETDVQQCPKCHGRLRLISTITELNVAHAIVDRLGMPTGTPTVARARDPTAIADEEAPDFADV